MHQRIQLWSTYKLQLHKVVRKIMKTTQKIIYNLHNYYRKFGKCNWKLKWGACNGKSSFIVPIQYNFFVSKSKKTKCNQHNNYLSSTNILEKFWILPTNKPRKISERDTICLKLPVDEIFFSTVYFFFVLLEIVCKILFLHVLKINLCVLICIKEFCIIAIIVIFFWFQIL